MLQKSKKSYASLRHDNYDETDTLLLSSFWITGIMQYTVNTFYIRFNSLE